MALAGGSTPREIYRRIAEAHASAIDRDALELFFGAERGVPPDHPDSNWRMARETFIAPLGIPAERAHPMPAWEDDLEAAARRYEAELRRLLPASPDGFPVLDLVWLGLGEDGHTASLFPGSAALEERRAAVVATTAPGGAPRMTLTLPAIASARHVQLLVTGARKAAALAEALRPGSDLPAARVAAAARRVEWLADREAAGGAGSRGR